MSPKYNSKKKKITVKSPSGKQPPLHNPEQALHAASGKSSGGWFSFLFKPANILLGLVALFFLMWCNTSVPSYNWVYNDLLKSGYKYCEIVQQEIDKRSQTVTDPILRKKIAYDLKYEAKVGVEYDFLKFIRENTPDNAIILFPPNDIITKKTNYLTLKSDLDTKTWVSHFLYPRTVVYEREKSKNPFYAKAQYIVLLHGWGYDHLDYKPAQYNAVDILPLHKQK
jgi:hypothetical protein